MANIPSKKTLAKATIIFGGTQTITVLTTLVRSKIAAITIGTAGVGLMTLYTSIAQFMAQFTNLGVQDSSVQVLSSVYAENNKEKTEKMVSLLRLWEVITASAAILLTLILSPLFARIYFGSVTQHFHSLLALSLAPASLTVTAIEMSILKCLQRPRMITSAITLSAIISIVLTLPLFIYMGWNGIIFIVLIGVFLSAFITASFGYRACSVKPDFSRLKDIRGLWADSRKLIIMGLTFVVCGLSSMGSDLLLQTYFNTISSIDYVGFYKLGYQMSILYPGMIFTAVNYDFFPRLSQMASNVETRNALVKRQIIVLLFLVTPCIALYIVCLPWIIPLVLSEDFSAITSMVRVGCLVTLVRCISLPVGYLPMAIGKPKDFMQIELVSYAAMVVCVIMGLKVFGMIGVGVGFVTAYIVEFLYSLILCRRKYGLRF